METRGVVSFVTPGDAAALSPNKRLHHMARARLVKEWREKVALQLKALSLSPFAGKVRVSFVVYRSRRMDEDNLRASGCLKAATDSLVDCGLIPDDNPDWVEAGAVTQVIGKEWRAFPHGSGPRVVVQIEEVE